MGVSFYSAPTSMAARVSALKNSAVNMKKTALSFHSKSIIDLPTYNSIVYDCDQMLYELGKLEKIVSRMVYTLQ